MEGIIQKSLDSFYPVLGLRPGATLHEIKSAYRSLAKVYHPDHDPSPDAEEKYAEIRAAYDALRKPVINTSLEYTSSYYAYTAPEQAEETYQGWSMKDDDSANQPEHSAHTARSSHAHTKHAKRAAPGENPGFSPGVLAAMALGGLPLMLMFGEIAYFGMGAVAVLLACFLVLKSGMVRAEKAGFMSFLTSFTVALEVYFFAGSYPMIWRAASAVIFFLGLLSSGKRR